MNSQRRVLVVEDHETERKAICQILQPTKAKVLSVESAEKALGLIDEGIDVVISDLALGEASGLDLLHTWQPQRPQTLFVLLTGETSVRSVVAAMRAGAYDYVAKPVDPEELLAVVQRALELVRKDREIAVLRQRLDDRFGLDHFVGQSPPMREVFARIRKAAAVDSTVLILGESGTGKELVAQALHQNSPRKHGPFVAVNCAAVPATLVESELFGHVRGAFTGAIDRRMGRFEQANGGTLFIDEIGDFELGLQAKLLRVLESFTVTPVGGGEEQKVDVRVLAATSRDIQKMLADRLFREDLYYRLNVVTITVPPLRDRPEDIPLLVEHFLKQLAPQRSTPMPRLSSEVMRHLTAYRWPGNVRELRNALESMVVLSDAEELTEEDLPERIHEHSREPAAT